MRVRKIQQPEASATLIDVTMTIPEVAFTDYMRTVWMKGSLTVKFGVGS